MICPSCGTNNYSEELNLCLDCKWHDSEIYSEYDDLPLVERIRK